MYSTNEAQVGTLPCCLDRLDRHDFEPCLRPSSIPDQLTLRDREVRFDLCVCVGMPRHRRARADRCDDQSVGRERLNDCRDHVLTRGGRPLGHADILALPASLPDLNRDREFDP